jgi:hypothetical protein
MFPQDTQIVFIGTTIMFMTEIEGEIFYDNFLKACYFEQCHLKILLET